MEMQNQNIQHLNELEKNNNNNKKKKKKYIVLSIFFIVFFVLISGLVLMFKNEKISVKNKKVSVTTNKLEYFTNGLVSEDIVIKIQNNNKNNIQYDKDCEGIEFKIYKKINKEWRNKTPISLCSGMSTVKVIEALNFATLSANIVEEGEYRIYFKYYDGEDRDTFSKPFKVVKKELSLNNSIEFCKSRLEPVENWFDNQPREVYYRYCLGKVAYWIAEKDIDKSIEICNLAGNSFLNGCHNVIMDNIVKKDYNKAFNLCNNMSEKGRCFSDLIKNVDSLDSNKAINICYDIGSVEQGTSSDCFKRVFSGKKDLNIEKSLILCDQNKYQKNNSPSYDICLKEVAYHIAAAENIDKAIEMCGGIKDVLQQGRCYYSLINKIPIKDEALRKKCCFEIFKIDDSKGELDSLKKECKLKFPSTRFELNITGLSPNALLDINFNNI